MQAVEMGGMWDEQSCSRVAWLQCFFARSYGGWRSTEGSLMAFRLLEPKIIDVGQGQCFFDLAGRWHGPELVMDDRGGMGSPFRSGLRIEHALVILEWGGYSGFKTVCASATNYPGRR
jgi:hypothetical protein